MGKQKSITWLVYPWNSNGNTIAEPVLIEAMTKATAEKSGKTLFKTHGIKNVRWTLAIPIF